MASLVCFDDAIVVAIGGNLPGRMESSVATLELALEKFHAAKVNIVARSDWWRSAAWPDPADPDYINGVVLVETALPPSDLLLALHDIETAYGRQRMRPNAPRTVDLDLIAYGRRIMSGPDLVLPHPRAADRLFVMGPLAQIAPDWRHPQTGALARDLAAQAGIGRDAHPLATPT